MNELRIFSNEEFGNVRTLAEKDTLWFCGKDILSALEYKEGSNPAKAFQAVPDEWKGVKPIHTPGGEQNVLFLSEQGLYFFLGRSDKPKALPYQRYIAGEVVPSIRKYGMYVTEELLANPDFAIQVFQQLKEEREARRLSEAKAERLEAQNAIQNQRIAEMEPKATYYDEVLKCRDSLPTSIIAKDYGWSAKRLNKFLEENGVQYKLRGTWLLKQKYAGFGYTKSETFPFEGTTGNVHTAINTKWTQKGRLFIYDMMKKHGNLPLIEQELQL